eukprot:7620697-Alexandrium_andersonii.AAC.1
MPPAAAKKKNATPPPPPCTGLVVHTDDVGRLLAPTNAKTLVLRSAVCKGLACGSTVYIMTTVEKQKTTLRAV